MYLFYIDYTESSYGTLSKACVFVFCGSVVKNSGRKWNTWRKPLWMGNLPHADTGYWTRTVTVASFPGLINLNNVDFTYEPCHEKTCLCHMRTTKAQISLRICTVWSASCLDSIIPLVSIFEISSLYLASVSVCFRKPKDRFSRDEAHMDGMANIVDSDQTSISPLSQRIVSGQWASVHFSPLRNSLLNIWDMPRQGFATMQNSNRPVQLQKLARGFEFQI